MLSSGTPSLSFGAADALVAFLEERGARRVRHSKRTFLDHLVGTAAILERWGGSDRVCKAGLFHSIYGTEYFQGAILSFDERPRIQALLGDEAERLAYIFCAFDRRSIYPAIERGEPYVVKQRSHSEIPVSPTELQDLVWMLWANELEQATHLAASAEARARSRQAIARSARHLPPRALRELEAVYGLL